MIAFYQSDLYRLNSGQSFRVSRTTLRGAIRQLESEGKLLVKHGSGTFATRPLPSIPSIPSSLDRLYSTGDMIRSAGLREDEQLKSIQRVSARLLQQPQATVLLLKQLHYDELNRQVLYSLDYVRNDIFRFWVRRTR